MSVKNFEDLYNDEEMNWKWDESELVFRATDSMMRVVTLKPTHAILEVEESVDDGDNEEE